MMISLKFFLLLLVVVIILFAVYYLTGFDFGLDLIFENAAGNGPSGSPGGL